MPYRLDRPAGDFAPEAGLLRMEHFQVGYVTNDIDRALTLFGERLGIRQFARLEGAMPSGGHIRAEFAWVGTVMYEIITADGPGSDLYMDRLPPGDGFAIAHHHLGYLVQDQAQWDGVLATAARDGCSIPFRGANPLVEFCFVDVPPLGHLLEYLFATEAGLDFFAGVPRS